MRFWLQLGCLLISGVLAPYSAQAQESPGTLPSSAQRRDPTAPSAEILKRLAAAAPAVDALLSGSSAPPPADEIVEVAPPFPELILKGLVLSDPDHGTALLEAGDRRVTVRLSRDSADSATLVIPRASRLSGFSVQGIEFYVLDFSDRALLLQTPDRTVLVQ